MSYHALSMVMVNRDPVDHGLTHLVNMYATYPSIGEIILMDDASTDESVWSTLPSKVRRCSNPTSQGWLRSYIFAWIKVQRSWICLIHPWTFVDSKSMDALIVEWMTHGQQTNCVYIPNQVISRPPWCPNGMTIGVTEWESMQSSGLFSTGCIIVHVSVLTSLNLLLFSDTDSVGENAFSYILQQLVSRGMIIKSIPGFWVAQLSFNL